MIDSLDNKTKMTSHAKKKTYWIKFLTQEMKKKQLKQQRDKFYYKINERK